MAKYAAPENICIVTGRPNADLHHLKTRGSGGTDDSWNLISLSNELHVELHNKGLIHMANKYPQIRSWLKENSWEFDPILFKWVHNVG